MIITFLKDSLKIPVNGDITGSSYGWRDLQGSFIYLKRRVIYEYNAG